MSSEIEAAYAACRAIARKQAKNFYYAFVALPREKRDAICAVYAFMRHADDLSDDESLPVSERRLALDRWLNRWHAMEGRSTDPPVPFDLAPFDPVPRDPVFVALLDAQRRFNIPSRLLDQLVEGTATDVAPAGSEENAGALATYETFEDLYRYCYLVASVVGLVCIRIFGYHDLRAEKLAEETGVAFQLTNILRDVREDAERGRLYLPLEDLRRCGVKPEEFVGLSSGKQLTANQSRVLSIQAARAAKLYQASRELLPLISSDSRPALWVLVAIYHRLLLRIEGRNFDVFSERVSVPTYEKLAILGRGILKTMWNRLLPAAS